MTENFVVEINRIQKAEKIRLVLEDYMQRPLTGQTILDIGCGNGLIAHCLAGYGNNLSTVDVADQRDMAYSGDYAFFQVTDERLPFADDTFDIVVSNHVIEHVAGYERHLAEIRRVLKSGGLCYFATPNRYFPYEVHYKLFFLHWLPQALFVKTLKAVGKYSYPVKLLGYYGLRKSVRPCFTATEYTHKIIKSPQQFAFGKLPGWFSNLYTAGLNFISPTLIYVLRKKSND